MLLAASLALLAVSRIDAFPQLPAATPFASDSSNPPFDANSQYVSTSGIHAPLALWTNEGRAQGYLPRTGLATIPEFVIGTRVLGMATDLSTVLAAYGAIFDGAGGLWSIGGIFHTGISGGHNNYESDSSALKSDLNQYGSNDRLVMSQFFELYNMQRHPATANYDLEVIRNFRSVRFNESISKNPDFYYGPFSGVLVTQAAYAFIFRLMGNKSAEHPTGVLNKEVLKSFMSIHGPEDDLRWVPGHERIPDNWYTRNENDLYTMANLKRDAAYLGEADPRIKQPGCNRGRVNSYVPINTTAMTNGAYTPADVLADPQCFAIAYASAMIEELSLGTDTVAGELFLPVQNALGCTTIPSLNTTVAKACPGYSLYGGPTGTVAKGAVQH